MGEFAVCQDDITPNKALQLIIAFAPATEL